MSKRKGVHKEYQELQKKYLALESVYEAAIKQVENKARLENELADACVENSVLMNRITSLQTAIKHLSANINKQKQATTQYVEQNKKYYHKYIKSKQELHEIFSILNTDGKMTIFDVDGVSHPTLARMLEFSMKDSEKIVQFD